ncbi:hypothetical protein ABE10_02480, partial [Bacillus toyonensis]|nr:hypothetical protein [Bacillus toyonensis]
SGVGEHVAVDPARVAEEMSHRHRGGDVLVRGAELGDIVRDRCVEVEESAVDERHHRRRRPHLADRADLEDGVVGGLDAGAHVEDAVMGIDRVLAQTEDAEGRSGDLVLRRQCVEPLLPVRGVDPGPSA